MQEKRIYLSELQDDDIICIQDKLYKVIKLKEAFDSLLESINSILSVSLSTSGAGELGLLRCDCYNRHFLPSEFNQEGVEYKFIKLGYSGWQTGLFKISIKIYLSPDKFDTDNKNLVSYYSFENFNFQDEDILSFSEHKFCTVKEIKDSLSSVFEHHHFRTTVSSIFSQLIPELKDINLFLSQGISLKFLKVELAKWQIATLRICFSFESRSKTDIEFQHGKTLCPLDEIRNSSV